MTDTEIIFEWKPVVEGEIAHVQEYVDGELKITYGPMSTETVAPFIIECKQRLCEIFARLYGEN